MKKLISLLLVVIFICSALVGCDWGSIFDKETSTTTLKWEAPEGMVETKVTDENGKSSWGQIRITSIEVIYAPAN